MIFFTNGPKTFFKFLIIAIFLGTVKSVSECNGNNCRSAFSCPGRYNCTCSKGLAGEYDLLCPGIGINSVISASVLPKKYIQIQCTHGTHFTDYDLLNGLQVGPVISVNFRQCPLPNKSFLDLIKSIGIESTNSLLFQSHKNLSNTLERKHFKNLANLTRLVLSSNGFTDLPENLLQDVANLTWLDLRGNKMHLHEKFFDSVPNLLTLELGNNYLKYLEPRLFRHLTKLQHLNLWKNQLKNLTRDVFSSLKQLRDLDISTNGMLFLPSDVFRDLTELERLSLYGNNYYSMPENLFSTTFKLEVLRLHDNTQTMQIPNYFLSNLSNLQEVYLMRNNIKSVPENIFWESPAILNISLQGNLLNEIPQELFRDQINLKTLDLSYNELKNLPERVFQNLENLEFLKLGNNHLQSIEEDVFLGLNKLELLDLEVNELKYIDSEALEHLKELKHARFSHNQLTLLEENDQFGEGFSYQDTFGSKSPFRYCVGLEYLYLSNNSISEIFSDWRIVLVRLKVLDLSHNKISYLIVQDVQFISHEISVDLRYNEVSVINLHGIEALVISQATDSINQQQLKRNVRIFLAGNPLQCDCRAYDMIRYFENKLQPEVYDFVTLISGNLTCNAPKEMIGIQAAEVNSGTLLCNIDKTSNCPENCECKFRRADWGLIVNCTEKKLTKIPKKLPNIMYTNHTELFLAGNYIEQLPNVTYAGYENVTHLYLSRNKIKDVDIGFLSFKIEELALDHNNITKFSSNFIKFLSQAPNIRMLQLNNNPFNCECSSKDLLHLIQLRFTQIPFLSNVSCSKDNKQLSHLSVSDLCPLSEVVIATCVVFAALGILAGSLAFFYYRYQREVKIWLYSHHFCLWFVTEQELDKDKLYDAFISYSHKDEDFVVNTLVPELEYGDIPFKLCLHYRDWIAGEWIPNQIARSVENSRRTLVVLSQNFLESVWGRMEFRAAHKQALSEGRARVIVIVYGDVGPTDQLDPELRAYISMNTYVKWGDPWFWGKLKYALPHPPSLVKPHLNLIKGRGSRKEKNFIDDKFELIHTLDSPSTSPWGTTPPSEAVISSMETLTLSNGNISHSGNKQLKTST